MPEKKKKTTRRNPLKPAVPECMAFDSLEDLLKFMSKTNTPPVEVLTYREARDRCAHFINTVTAIIREESTDMENIATSEAGKDILETLKTKYEMVPVSNACVLLLTLGMSMLEEMDRQLDALEQRREKE